MKDENHQVTAFISEKGNQNLVMSSWWNDPKVDILSQEEFDALS